MYLISLSSIAIATLSIYSFLLLATLATAITTRGRPDSGLRPRVYAWWVIAPVITASLLTYPLGVLALVLLIAGLALQDICRLSVKPAQTLGCAALIAMMIVLIVMLLPARAALVLGCLYWLAYLFFLLNKHRQACLLIAWCWTACGLGFLYLLTVDTGIDTASRLSWLFFLIVCTCLNDVAQYLTGTRFGKHKLVASVSPNKTVQGLIGGLLFSAVFCMLLGSYLQLASLPWLCAIGIWLAIAGFCGDLLFSAVKRRLGIKDFSSLIPGHGGILDRADSLMLTAPALYVALRIVQ
ncbi:phosphatidate cytidylyltransferase [Undibacterium rugosum]|uniref:phosphatidate cytidylyltransferase n=1 Tax=Undibacterium rugosum TaxID=2762291 RepID=UPI001B832934|nr:phosphatidate cytidylyltransferase [Undibacterium rugosum]MBR7778954.1 phosphatidate cytidylyltransferase [Undibacterium rugosum]